MAPFQARIQAELGLLIMRIGRLLRRSDAKLEQFPGLPDEASRISLANSPRGTNADQRGRIGSRPPIGIKPVRRTDRLRLS